MMKSADEDSRALAFVAEFVAATRQGPESGLEDRELRNYYSYLGEAGLTQARRHLRYLRFLVGLSGHPIQGSTILDIGCAYGLNVLLFSLLGAKQSLGVELQDKCVLAFEALCRRLRAPDADRAEVRSGDAARLPFKDASVDIVLAMECVSHILDVDRFVRETHRVLRPGGALVIADSNNASNPWVRWRRRSLWDAAENGPPGRRVGNYVCVKPYRQIRQEILRAAFSDLSDREASSLARKTFAMTREQILDAARTYRLTGKEPDRPFVPGVCAVNPARGYCLENAFRPFPLARSLGGQGFDCRAYPYFGGARGGWIATANRVLSSLPRLTIGLSRAYRLVARKRAA